MPRARVCSCEKPECRVCASRARAILWYKNNKARKQAYMKQIRETDPERLRAPVREWYRNNKDKARGYSLKARGVVFAPGQTVASMLEAQKGLCAICAERLGTGKKLHVDHCHVSGAVRGLLCNHCNLAIGHLRDRPERALAAAAYLEAHAPGQKNC